MKKGALARGQAPKTLAVVDEASLLVDLRHLVEAARQRVATVANATHTMLCWHIGRRLLRDNLQEGRAAYGKRILATVSQELTAEFGEGFALRTLYRSIQFSQVFPDEAIVSTLSAQLSWSHFMELLATVSQELTAGFGSGRRAVRFCPHIRGTVSPEFARLLR